MAVVTGSSDLITNLRVSRDVPRPARARGRIIIATGSVTHAADDSNTSKWLLAEIPADAILHKLTAFKTDTWMMGANVAIGLSNDADALYTGAKGAALTPVAFGDGKHGLPAWQVLGLAARPESNVLGIWLHALADATAVGSAKFEIAYLYD